MTRIVSHTTSEREEVHPTYTKDFLVEHKNRILAALKAVGAGSYNMLLPETHSMYLVIHPFEQITGVVYGRYKQDRQGLQPITGRGVLVATDKRIVFVDKKPLFIRSIEISYMVVAGIAYSRVGLIGTVTLYNKTGDIRIRTFNQTCAYHFVEAVEEHIHAYGTPVQEVG